MICPDCGVDKDAASFDRCSRAKSGRQTYCKPCKRRRSESSPNRRAVVAKYRGSHQAGITYRTLARRALASGQFVMPRPDFIAWHAAQEKCCAYCGMSADQALAKFGHNLHVDRKDCAVGYVESNICLACHRCNVVKSRYLTHAQMKEVAQRYFLGAHDELVAALRNIQVTAVDADLRATFQRTALEMIAQTARAALAKVTP